MSSNAKVKSRAEFGDFQTPPPLANRVCALLAHRGFRPASVLEPTCGTGTFIEAAIRMFPSAQRMIGLEINPHHVARARSFIRKSHPNANVQVRQADFFQTNWKKVVSGLPGPMLVLGNPPWVTSADLTRLGSSNLPTKTNVHGHRGLDALTGKGNFDISEWMLLRALEWIEGREATLAILCKVAVVRRVLRHAWGREQRLRNAEVRGIDADRHFGASVDACLFIISGSAGAGEVECAAYDSLEAAAPSSRFGLRDGELVANLELYEKWKHLAGPQRYRWRSGVKHDCSKVMELRRTGPNTYVNGLREEVQLEPRFLFPMLKSSEVANGAVAEPTRWMLVTQSTTGDDTSRIEAVAPRTWRYLCAHADRLDRRGSTIYRNRARFSVFGVGPYTFAPWRVAVSGFYKNLNFRTVGSFEGKPIVLDDTCYFVPCGSKAQAHCVHELLNSTPAQELLGAFAFWDSKRPVTAGLLNRLDLLTVAQELGADERTLALLRQRSKRYGGDQLELL